MNVIYCNYLVLRLFLKTGKETETQRNEITCHVLSWGVAELRFQSRPPALAQGQLPGVPVGQEALEPSDSALTAAETAAAWAARPRCPQQCSGIWHCLPAITSGPYQGLLFVYPWVTICQIHKSQMSQLTQMRHSDRSHAFRVSGFIHS